MPRLQSSSKSPELQLWQPSGWHVLTLELWSADQANDGLPSAVPARPQWAYFLWADPVDDLRHEPPTEWGVAEGEPGSVIRGHVGKTPVRFIEPGDVDVPVLLRMLRVIGDVPDWLQQALDEQAREAQARERALERQAPAFCHFLQRLIGPSLH